MSEAQGRKSSPQAGSPQSDGVTALCAFIVLLFTLPTAFIVGSLGSVGSPATLVGLLAFVWWAWYHLNRWKIRDIGPQPVRWALLILFVAILISYVHAMFLPIAGDEVSPADSSLLRMLSLFGIALVANDGIRSTARMNALIRCFIVMVSLVSILSVIQFATGQLWIDRLSIPGLTMSRSLGLDERQAFTRPSATATHPIEFASVLGMVLPLTIMYAKSRPKIRFVHLLPVGLIVVGVLLSLSRTGILCMALGLVLILPAIPRTWRLWGIAGGVAMLGVFYVTIPGFVGTVRGLFAGFSNNPSIQSRTEAYASVVEFFMRSPLIGRGLGTFLPKYVILDNMYLQFLIEIGILGLVAALGLFITALASCWGARRTLPTSQDRDLAIGVAAGVAAGALSFAFFDGLAFPQSAFTLFLMIGMCGAYWRLAQPGRDINAARQSGGGIPHPIGDSNSRS